jgi:hypothetical protein
MDGSETSLSNQARANEARDTGAPDSRLSSKLSPPQRKWLERGLRTNHGSFFEARGPAKPAIN